ncbi:MAG TPA: 2-polyprenyl-3-methyl-6-methoxy-1,4-benzoquinone monooxygenase [Gammaproteobacteria bacterium]|nr:2-polyprenyl-3-methyl-6-methoxy-1,4-benzoquinone monooxygenase [Gammaproteobacteria bacterium]
MHGSLAWRDRLIGTIDQGLRTLAAHASPARPSPADELPESSLSDAERRLSAALLRVNHAGEISAQALYSGQALVARSESTREHLEAAANEEHDHLAWCATRLTELGGRASLLDPFWYLGSFCLGVVAGSLSDRSSLGFVAETERQVEAHLQDHLERLPKNDRKSQAILSRMAADEAHHGTMASLAGGAPLPAAIRSCMSLGGGLLRRIASIV